MSQKLSLKIGHLYGNLMNTYGDDGNITVLTKRCQWRDIKVEVIKIPLKYKIKPQEFDLYFFGGGQDQAQEIVANDLSDYHKNGQLLSDLNSGVPMLSICGGYQLMGEYYQPFEGPNLYGLSFFPAYTVASHDRMIGNIVIELNNDLVNQFFKVNSDQPINLAIDSLLVGFENHSGKTFLKEDATPLGKVIKGFGNNGGDKGEGCIHKNSIGCYMHGSLLPKNPFLADWLIEKALEVKYQEFIKLTKLDDKIERQAHFAAVKRFG